MSKAKYLFVKFLIYLKFNIKLSFANIINFIIVDL